MKAKITRYLIPLLILTIIIILIILNLLKSESPIPVIFCVHSMFILVW